MFRVVKGDKVVVKKDIDTFCGSDFAKAGDVYEVTDVSDGHVRMRNYPCGNGIGTKTMQMSLNMLNKYFNKVKPVVEEHEHKDMGLPNSITSDLVDHIFDSSEVVTTTAFNKCTIMACKLPNDFVIVESSACVDPDNYNRKLGEKICEKKIKDKIWELEGYMLSTLIANDFDDGYDDEDFDQCEHDVDCEDCSYFQYCYGHEEDADLF